MPSSARAGAAWPPAVKIVLTHLGALRRKHGAQGVSQIAAAVADLAAADAARGVETRLVAMDDGRRARGLGVSQVSDAGDVAAAKAFADAAAARWEPSYILLLGSPDVVPMPGLANPLWAGDPRAGDPDETIPSDLPYASDAPHSTDAGTFVGATRVVGRLPDGTGARGPAQLLRLLATSARHRTRRRSSYLPAFALTAAEWRGSTAATLTKLAGDATELHDAPPDAPPWPAAQTRRRLHLVNLHGAVADPRFYGQRGRSFPVALDAAELGGGRRLVEGTVCAAECCYGGMLFDPAESGGVRGFADTYLAAGAYGYCAATNVAYGPADTNDAADLVCRAFLQHVLAGCSVGRAMLQARQDYAFTKASLSPIDIKTLAQFTLFGDPSVQPIVRPTAAVADGAAVPKGALAAPPGGIAARRRRLVANGRALETTTTRAASVPRELNPRERRVIAELLPSAEGRVLSFDVMAAAAAVAGPGERFHVALERRPSGLRAIVAREEAGRMQQVTLLRAR